MKIISMIIAAILLFICFKLFLNVLQDVKAKINKKKDKNKNAKSSEKNENEKVE